MNNISLTVKIERAGDVIPHVVEVDLKREKPIQRNLFFQKNALVALKRSKNLIKLLKNLMLLEDALIEVLIVIEWQKKD